MQASLPSTSAGEWYAENTVLRPLLARTIACSASILLACAGGAADNLTLHEHLWDSGYRGVTAIHPDSQVVQQWRQRNDAALQGLTCHVASLAEGLAFEHTPYDAIIDKGALDEILCRDGGVATAVAALQHVHANLQEHGTLLLLTSGTPSLRLPLLRSVAWESVATRMVVCVPSDGDAAELRDWDGGSSSDNGLLLQRQVACWVYSCRKPLS